jgi:hypothetical protein
MPFNKPYPKPSPLMSGGNKAVSPMPIPEAPPLERAFGVKRPRRGVMPMMLKDAFK